MNELSYQGFGERSVSAGVVVGHESGAPLWLPRRVRDKDGHDGFDVQHGCSIDGVQAAHAEPGVTEFDNLAGADAYGIGAVRPAGDENADERHVVPAPRMRRMRIGGSPGHLVKPEQDLDVGACVRCAETAFSASPWRANWVDRFLSYLPVAGRCRDLVDQSSCGIGSGSDWHSAGITIQHQATRGIDGLPTSLNDQEMNGDEKRIALLIDAENASTSNIDKILEQLGHQGTATVRRAYGDWTSLPQTWKDTLHDHAIRPVQQFAYTARKNASDIAMVIDAVDLLHAHRFDAFAIVSSDADFTPLVMRIRANGVKVYGFGDQKTPMSFVNACTQFTKIGESAKPLSPPTQVASKVMAPKASGSKKTTNVSKPKKTTKAGKPKDLQDPRVQQLLRNAVNASKNENGWSHLGEVGAQIRQGDESFNRRDYGHGSLRKLFVATGLFDVERQDLTVFVRASSKK